MWSSRTAASRASEHVPAGARAPIPTHWALDELDAAHVVASADDAPALDAEALAQAAYDRGFHDGLQSATLSEGERMRAALTVLHDAVRDVRQQATAWTSNAQENICALAVAVAQQIIGRELQGDAGMVRELVRRALTELPLDQPVTVRLHPEDLRLLADASSAPDVRPLERAEFQWVADPRLHRGGCLIEGRDRIIDGRVDTALERLYRRLSSTGA
jgi:flagellar biosynthesis/type III secretory pathway protein FliH